MQNLKGILITAAICLVVIAIVNRVEPVRKIVVGS
jgi:hypothetical protein